MGKINGCLKCLFIFFNVFFAIIGGVLIYLAVKVMDFSTQMQATGLPGVVWLWVLAIGTLAISSLAIYAACSENHIVLKVFAGLMGFGMIVMLIFGIIVVVSRNQVKEAFHSVTSDVVKSYMEEESLRALLKQSQKDAKCCGMVRAEDWGSDIPPSCECQRSNGGAADCRSKPQGATGPAQIYKKSCGELFFYLVDIGFKIFMGLCFGFALIALMGLLVSLLMIHQVRRYDSYGGQGIAMKGF
ncbi:tetraspanin-8-like [Genypterus blacodes]|uniref:tetraspanin-8-like n=1 Tax=Genypterus blacodes TaxID=154954 RepID=UPI003F75E82D